MTERKVYKLKKEEKPFICNKCNKSFKEERHLQRHLLRKISCDKKFICEKCKKHFRDNTALTAHLNRITSCVVDEVPVIDETKDENRCRYCNKTYATPYSLKRHQKTCDKESNMKQIMDLLTEQDKKWEQRLVQITGMNLSQLNHIEIDNSTTNLTVNNFQNMYVNITICSFGHEDLSKLDQQGVIDLLKGQVEDFMPKMIEYIHANPNHPEFHNVFYDPVRKKALVFKQNKDQQLTWQFEDIEHVSKLLTEKIKDHIHPLNGPYFNSLSKAKDSDTANKIPQILCTNWQTPKIVEGTKESLSKITKNEGFMDQVSVLE